MPRALTVIAPLTFVVSGCSGATWGNLSVLVITCGIFFGTLSLGRRVHAPGTATPPSISTDDGKTG